MRLRTQPAQSSKTIVVIMNSHVYTLETHDLWWCSQSFSLPVLALILMIVRSILASIWYQNHVFPQSFFGWFIWLIFYWILTLKGMNISTFFHHLFDPVRKTVFGTSLWLTLVPFSAPFLLFLVSFWLYFGSPSQCFSHRWFVDDFSIAFLINFW